MRRTWLFTVIAVSLGALIGCQGRGDNSQVVLSKAQTALDLALDGWSRQERPEKFHCIDADWQAGVRLLSFLTSDAEMVRGQRDQVRCRVALSLQDPQGECVDTHAFYLVQLGDPITVRRVENPTK